MPDTGIFFGKGYREGLKEEMERDVYTPMMVEYEEVVGMIVQRMVADLRQTNKVALAK